jgi:hypothetical protein
MNTARCQMCESFRVMVVVAPGGRGLCLTCGWRWWEPMDAATGERRLGSVRMSPQRAPVSPPSISVRRTPPDRAAPPLPVSPSPRPANPSHPSVLGTP